MRAHYLQHVPFEGLGSIETWLQESGYEISATQFFQAHQLPDAQDIDMLVVMGGPMSVNDRKTYPWLEEELRFIRQTIELKVPTLGICLGAQLIARAMGADVMANAQKEIGWHPIQGIKTTEASCFQFPESVEVFHWHGETFNLPAGAVRIAESTACRNQAYQLGKHVIGLQFHLETTPDSARAIVSHCRDELTEGLFIQGENDILCVRQGNYSSINHLMSNVLDYLHNC